MTTDDVLDVFREAGALLEGHFILSSGRRSPVFLQKALIFKNPETTAKLCAALADKIRAKLGTLPDIIIAPAMGGVIPGYEMARQLGLESMFMERVEGEFELRRGFTLEPGQTVLMVEDIVDTARTLDFLMKLFTTRSPASLKMVTLLDKKGTRQVPLRVDYVCFDIPNKFVVGYGLDYAERLRELREVIAFNEPAFQRYLRENRASKL